MQVHKAFRNNWGNMKQNRAVSNMLVATKLSTQKDSLIFFWFLKKTFFNFFFIH